MENPEFYNDADLTLMQFLVAVFLVPFITSLINRPHWSSARKALVAINLIFLASLGFVWLTGNWTGANLVANLRIILVTTMAAYKLAWQPLGLKDALEQKVKVFPDDESTVMKPVMHAIAPMPRHDTRGANGKFVQKNSQKKETP